MSIFCTNNSGAAYVSLLLIPCGILVNPMYLLSINRVIRMLRVFLLCNKPIRTLCLCLFNTS